MSGRIRFLLCALIAAGCAALPLSAAPTSGLLPAAAGFEIHEFSRSDRQWTGVAVSTEGRVFVNFPRWSEEVPAAVLELREGGMRVPYPDERWNAYDRDQDRAEQFVGVQAMWADDRGRLWILDTGNPMMEGVVEGAAKIVVVDLETDSVERIIRMKAPALRPGSYLNDIRVDTGRGFAYLTDSGAGGLVVVDLSSEQARRVLTDHPSTRWESTAVIIDGQRWTRGGSIPQIHADGIALSDDGETLYYQALSGRTLYRMPTAPLRDFDTPEATLAEAVETVARTGVADGILLGPEGHLYLTALEANAIHRLTPEGQLEVVAQDDALLRWPDTLVFGPDGDLYVTISQIHLGPDPAEPYRLLRIAPTGEEAAQARGPDASPRATQGPGPAWRRQADRPPTTSR